MNAPDGANAELAVLVWLAIAEVRGRGADAYCVLVLLAIIACL